MGSSETLYNVLTFPACSMDFRGQRIAHTKNKEEWATILTLIDSTSDRASRRIADMNRKQLDEVQRALQQMSILRTQEEERLRVEYRKEDKELRDVCDSFLRIPSI